jgi:glucosamine--fructose-6-phosphate aminotransferase (isomerizing)
MLEETTIYREIHEQPQAVSRLLGEEIRTVRQLAEAIRRLGLNHVVVAARGTSDNAGRYAEYLLGAVNRMMVGLATPSLFTIYQQPPRFGQCLVLGISQSGRSPDIVAVLAEARRQGTLTAAITNTADSDLARQADYVINLQAGEERAVAATKTYTCQLAAIALLSASLDDNRAMLDTLQSIPQTVADTLAAHAHMDQVVQRFCYMRQCVVIGRGYNYGTAFELALKLEELTYTLVEPYSSADFLHGPLALIEHGFPAIVVAPSGVPLPEMQGLIRTLRQREAEVVAISDDEPTLALAHTPLRLPQAVPEWVSPITAILPGQLFAMHLAHARRYDPDRPRALHKVTETL